MPALLDALLQLVASGVLLLGGYAITRVSAWLKLREDSEVRAYLNDALNRAVELAMAEARAALAPYAKPTGPVVDNIVERAAVYALDRVPDALKRFGIGEAALKDMLRSRLAARQLSSAPHAAA